MIDDDDNARSKLAPIDVHLTINRRHLVFGGTLEDVAKVRPGDEVRIAWSERGRERSCWARVTGSTYVGAWEKGTGYLLRTWPALAGVTSFGRLMTAAHALVTDVRAEHNEAIRASWVARYPS